MWLMNYCIIVLCIAGVDWVQPWTDCVVGSKKMQGRADIQLGTGVTGVAPRFIGEHILVVM